MSGDQTEILRAGYWPSYNVPFYEQVVHYCSHSSAFDVKISSSLSGAITLRSRETWNACAWDFIACATDETKLTLFKTVCETAPKSLFGVPTCVPGFEYASWLAFWKKPLSICQSDWKEIRNELPVICWVCTSGPRRRRVPNSVLQSRNLDPKFLAIL